MDAREQNPTENNNCRQHQDNLSDKEVVGGMYRSPRDANHHRSICILGVVASLPLNFNHHESHQQIGL